MKSTPVTTVAVIILLLTGSFLAMNISHADDNSSNIDPASNDTRALAKSAWPCFRGNIENTGLSSYDTAVNPGTLLWKTKMGHYVVSSPAIGPDGTIYVGARDGLLYAINPDGTYKWTYKNEDRDSIDSSPALSSDGTVYFTTEESDLYAINSDGSLQWTYDMGDRVGLQSSSPVVGPDGNIYAGSGDNKLYSLSPTGVVKWKFETEGMIISSPAIDSNGVTYFGSQDNNVYAVDRVGKLKWKFETGRDVDTSPALGSDGTVYIGSNDGFLYAIYRDGTLKWKYEIGLDDLFYPSSPAIGPGGEIYIGSSGGLLHSIYPDGTPKWLYKTDESIGSSPVIGSDGTIYFGTIQQSKTPFTGQLFAVDKDSILKWKYNIGEWVPSSPAIGSNGNVYIGSCDYYLYAFGKPILSKVSELVSTPGDGFVELSWEPPSCDGGSPIIKYYIYRGTEKGQEALFKTIDNLTYYMDAEVENEKTYFYRISPVNREGEGPLSDVIEATPNVYGEMAEDIAGEMIINFKKLDRMAIDWTAGFVGSEAELVRNMMDMDSNGEITTNEIDIFEEYGLESLYLVDQQGGFIELDDFDGTMTVTQYEIQMQDAGPQTVASVDSNTKIVICYDERVYQLSKHQLEISISGEPEVIEVNVPEGYKIINATGLETLKIEGRRATGLCIPSIAATVTVIFEEDPDHVAGKVSASGPIDDIFIIILVIIIGLIIISIFIFKKRRGNKRKAETEVEPGPDPKNTVVNKELAEGKVAIGYDDQTAQYRSLYGRDPPVPVVRTPVPVPVPVEKSVKKELKDNNDKDEKEPGSSRSKKPQGKKRGSRLIIAGAIIMIIGLVLLYEVDKPPAAMTMEELGDDYETTTYNFESYDDGDTIILQGTITDKDKLPAADVIGETIRLTETQKKSLNDALDNMDVYCYEIDGEKSLEISTEEDIGDKGDRVYVEVEVVDFGGLEFAEVTATFEIPPGFYISIAIVIGGISLMAFGVIMRRRGYTAKSWWKKKGDFDKESETFRDKAGLDPTGKSYGTFDDQFVELYGTKPTEIDRMRIALQMDESDLIEIRKKKEVVKKPHERPTYIDYSATGGAPETFRTNPESYLPSSQVSLFDLQPPVPVVQEPVYIPPPKSCPKCGAFLVTDAKFCGKCGEKFTGKAQFCVDCGSKLKPNVKFCGNCGSKNIQ